MVLKKFILFFGFIFSLVFFMGCDSKDAKTIVEDTGDFNTLKVISNKNYTLTTTSNRLLKFKVESDILSTEDSSLKGKYVLFNFWASWCEPCKKELPVIGKLQEKNPNRLHIVGNLMEKNKDKSDLANFMAKYKFNFPVTQGDENFRIAKAFDDVKMFPESFLFSPDGRFIKKYIGEVHFDDVQSLLQ